MFKNTLARMGLALGASVLTWSALAQTSASADAAKPFAGTTIHITTFKGVADALVRRAAEFEKNTGAKVNIRQLEFAELYPALMNDWKSGSNKIDGTIMMPQWMIDFVQPGYLEDLTDRVRADKELRERDIAPYFVAFSQRYNYRTYLLTLDGDFHLLYYRTDILTKLGKKPPQTWDEYLDVAQAAHGKDFGQGPVSGSCLAKKSGGQSYWLIFSIAGPYLQGKGTQEGAFFTRSEDFTPLVFNEGFARALQIYKDSGKFAPPNERNMDIGDTRKVFLQGNCAMTVDWGDIGTLAIDPKKSKVIDKVGVSILPGSKSIVDRGTGKLVACDASRCPHAADNGINHAPYAAAGGWSAGINAHSPQKVKDATYALFSYMSQPAQSNVDVTIGSTAFNPYRFGQFASQSLWTKAGMSPTAAKEYTGAVQNSLMSPNMVLDLRIPGNQKYQQIVLDQALGQYLSGETDLNATMKSIYDQWNKLSDEIGRKAQHKAYLSTIGAR